MDDATNPVHGSFLQALDAGPVKNLINPITQHLGEALGYIGDIVRFYSQQNLAKVFKKWAEAERGGKSLEEEEFKRVMPLLPLAAQVSDDDLQDRWAMLLESAARGEAEFLPSFGPTLSQLTAEEANFLDGLHRADRRKRDEEWDEESLLQIFDPSIKSVYYSIEYGSVVAPRDSQDRKKIQKGLSIIQDVERLGILAKTPAKTGPAQFMDVPSTMAEGRYVGMKIPIRQRAEADRVRYRLSSYGKSFLKAVSRKKPRGSGG